MHKKAAGRPSGVFGRNLADEAFLYRLRTFPHLQGTRIEG
jgi:hypothetical protein